MKIALLSFGHIDSVVPLYKHLRFKIVSIDLIFCFALNRKAESVLNFENVPVEIGLLAKKNVNELLSNEIKNYLGDTQQLDFFIYYNLKLRSIKNFQLSLKLANKLKDYDIIHINGTNGVLPILIYLLRKKKLVFTIHDIHSHSGEKTRFNFAEKMNEYIIKSKYPLIVQNQSDFEFLRKQHQKIAGKFKYIPFGVLDIYREYKNQNEKPINSDILLFGRISPYKGIEYLIEAIKELHFRGLRIKTVIAGSGQAYFDTAIFEKLNIKFINRHITNWELASIIEGTKIVVCPYTDATQSGVVMTAFAFNKPVIASNVGGFKDVMIDGYNGILVPPKNSGALAEAIIKLINANNLLEIMSKNIVQFENDNKDFAWPNISKKIIELYKDQ